MYIDFTTSVVDNLKFYLIRFYYLADGFVTVMLYNVLTGVNVQSAVYAQAIQTSNIATKIRLGHFSLLLERGK